MKKFKSELERVRYEVGISIKKFEFERFGNVCFIKKIPSPELRGRLRLVREKFKSIGLKGLFQRFISKSETVRSFSFA